MSKPFVAALISSALTESARVEHSRPHPPRAQRPGRVRRLIGGIR
jgi:hypothetical protein